MKFSLVQFFSITITLIGAMASLPAFAQTSFTCESTQAKTFTAKAELDTSGVLEKLTVDMEGEIDEVYSPAQAANYDVIAHLAKDSDVQKHDMLKALLKHAQPSSKPDSYVVHSITGKGKGITLDEIMEYIGDDLSGIVILEAFDQNKNVLGRSMIVGWGGYFNNCR